MTFSMFSKIRLARRSAQGPPDNFIQSPPGGCLGGAPLLFAKSLVRMSALPPKADIAAPQTNVRFVPKADIGRCGWVRLVKPTRWHERDVPRRTTNVG